MREIVVICGGAPAPARSGRDRLFLDVSDAADPAHRVNLKLASLSEQLVDNVPEVVADLIEVATYIYSADRLCRRGADTMARMGSEWRRRFHFVIPVRRLDIWRRQDVVESLVEALEYLTEDSFSFAFVPGSGSWGLEPYLGFDQPEAQAYPVDEVMLFSGGLDSLGGAVDALFRRSQSVALVTHRSSTFVAGRQNGLAAELSSRAASGAVFYAPIWVRKGDQEPVEHTQRSRSFLFAALGGALACMFGKSRFFFYENGITSFNLPIAEHVVGSRASRTTHPRTLANIQRLLSLLLDRPMTIENPFLWKTKAEVVDSITTASRDLIPVTISCAGVRDLPMKGTQCGVCSQCVERRFALLGTGMGQLEPPDAYATDLFRSGDLDTRSLTLIEHYVLRARRMASMSERSFVASYGQIFRALDSLPGAKPEIISKIYDLHRRYGHDIVKVVNGELKREATLDAALVRHPASLMAMITSAAGQQPVYADPIEREPVPSTYDGSDAATVAPRRTIVALDRSTHRVIVDPGIILRGNAFKLIAALADRFEEEVASQKSREAFGYTRRKRLEERLGWSEEQLRQQVLRTRRDLARRVAKATGYTLDAEDVIQSRKWHGYRLNPYIVIVEPAQISDLHHPSRSDPSSVTTEGAAP